jgi:hypothetical protein
VVAPAPAAAQESGGKNINELVAELQGLEEKLQTMFEPAPGRKMPKARALLILPACQLPISTL